MDQLEAILFESKFEKNRGWNGKRTKLTYDNVVPKIMFFAKWNNGKHSIDYLAREDIFDLLKKIAAEYFPDFNYNIVQINKNVFCKPHHDTANNGDTIIFTLGNFTGGEINIEHNKHNIYKQPHKFNGHKQLHWTEPFEGTRFSVIYYKSTIARSL